MGLKRLIVGGIAFLALMYAAGCNQTTSNNVRDDKSNVISTNRGSNKTIDDQIIPVPIGENGNGHNGNGNGNGPDPLYTLVEETIKKYDEKGAYLDVEKKGDIEEYISLIGQNLEKLANEDLSRLSKKNKERLSDAFNDYGLALVTGNQISEAIRYLKIAISLDPADDTPHFTLAAVLYKSGQAKDSWMELKEVLRINPNHQKALNSKRNLEKKYGFSN